jgi:hypothetical protein
VAASEIRNGALQSLFAFQRKTQCTSCANRN